MKVYRNNVCVTMNLDEFHDILESDMFDDLLLMIMELDDSTAIETVYGDHNEFTNHQVYEVEDMDSFMELLQDALDDDNVQYFMQESVGPEEGAAWWGINENAEDITKRPKNEPKKRVNKIDAKVKRILDRYKDVVA